MFAGFQGCFLEAQAHSPQLAGGEN
jgi:hypothetical protein